MIENVLAIILTVNKLLFQEIFQANWQTNFSFSFFGVRLAIFLLSYVIIN